ncbi:hypothetical protein Y032_0053g2396 [Ancylostoma ceylanicum]|uniref:SCP domain-containing protein n=1 Tax=Ancylostoma ceylanicum TaxID=53326 RepID=A0A016U715_9BILA|nr:hypothetical protein Y032_0053g2396 [Ancylostoma ceylanicum]
MISTFAMKCTVLLCLCAFILVDGVKGVGKIVPLSKEVKDKILDMHNYRRSEIATGNTKGTDFKTPYPTAAAMFEMKWDDKLAEDATAHAATCSMEASTLSERPSNQGENHNKFDFGAPSITSIRPPIQQWWVPSRNVQGLPRNLVYRSSIGEQLGFFTQMAWAKTYKIGCGVARCPTKNFFVCRYYPSGNIEGEVVYPTGRTGSGCTNGRSNRYQGLCRTPPL